ncbi:hypothetical protein [Kutzneria buriramensis]|uniref:Uncharacterized protein n=1 Tax=Kutzneria buriramensis TaxID=1045776 RepID=A0A3E0GV84_9PSEU|nr:hypothetical protein [Kutzneria buriramensis]REH28664.1 hypothetical protein BCF44_126106 [Kutzneria buriramensis]
MADTTEWLPLDTVRKTFAWLVTGPDPLCIDGREFDDLPSRLIPLDELRDYLLSRHCADGARDAVWAYVARRSRVERGAWTVACAGMALPNLAATAGWLAARFRGDRADVHAAVLTGFLDALASIDLDKPAIVVRLGWAARRAGQAALEESLDAPRPIGSQAQMPASASTGGNPELLVVEAIGEGVLTPTEADLIAATRLDRTSVADWAALRGRRVKAVYKARDRAEDRLVGWLRIRIAEADPNDPVLSAALSGLSVVDFSLDDEVPTRSRAVSGRLRNGRPVPVSPASNRKPATGLMARGETTDSSRTAPESEVRRCA